jgi:hypothetical protein
MSRSFIRSHLLWTTAALFALGLIVNGVRSTPPSSSRSPCSISFGGFTNGADGIRRARFTITNHSDRSFTVVDRYCLQVEGMPNTLHSNFLPSKWRTLLGAHRSVCVIIPEPCESQQWHAAFTVRERPLRGAISDSFESLPWIQKHLIPQAWTSRRSYSIRTELIGRPSSQLQPHIRVTRHVQPAPAAQGLAAGRC